jgi:hypothetical protein
MKSSRLSFWLVAALAATALVAVACGGSTGSTSKGTITIGSFSFPESSILAQLYGQALETPVTEQALDFLCRAQLLLRIAGQAEAVSRASRVRSSGPGGRGAERH